MISIFLVDSHCCLVTGYRLAGNNYSCMGKSVIAKYSIRRNDVNHNVNSIKQQFYKTKEMRKRENSKST